MDISGHTHHNYVKKHKARLKWAYKVAKENSSRESERHKQYYDHKFHCMALAPSDVVLVKMKALGQDHKIGDKWEQNLYIVISQMGNQPVFKVQPRNVKDHEGIEILHQNILYPIQTAQNDEQDSTTNSPEKSEKLWSRPIC